MKDGTPKLFPGENVIDYLENQINSGKLQSLSSLLSHNVDLVSNAVKNSTDAHTELNQLFYENLWLMEWDHVKELCYIIKSIAACLQSQTPALSIIAGYKIMMKFYMQHHESISFKLMMILAKMLLADPYCRSNKEKELEKKLLDFLHEHEKRIGSTPLASFLEEIIYLIYNLGIKDKDAIIEDILKSCIKYPIIYHYPHYLKKDLINMFRRVYSSCKDDGKSVSIYSVIDLLLNNFPWLKNQYYYRIFILLIELNIESERNQCDNVMING